MKKIMLTVLSTLLIMAINTNVFGQAPQTWYRTTKISNWDDATAWSCVKGTEADAPDCPNPMAPPPRTIEGKMEVFISHGTFADPFIINAGDPIVVKNAAANGIYNSDLAFGRNSFSKTFVNISTEPDSTGSYISFHRNNLDLNGNTMTINTGGELFGEYCLLFRNGDVIINGGGVTPVSTVVGIRNGNFTRASSATGIAWTAAWCDFDAAEWY